ncbi:MAG: helix-turn-helix domain-containing protein [Hyphomonadaceae bacterium]|nr:helix-turn-helix domain-containing protein [Hyphomonadaceae bacterium]
MNANSPAPQPRALNSRDHQREATRARVLDAARALFAERGYEEATIRDIAQRAGVAPGSVFTTFESKAELLQEIIYAQYEALDADLAAAQRAEGGLIERLTAAYALVYRFETRQLRLLAEAVGASWTWSEQQEADNRQRLGVLLRHLIAILEEGVARGEVRGDIDLALFADMIFACYLRNYRRAIFDGWTSDQLAALLRRQVTLLLHGAAAKAG